LYLPLAKIILYTSFYSLGLQSQKYKTSSQVKYCQVQKRIWPDQVKMIHFLEVLQIIDNVIFNR